MDNHSTETFCSESRCEHNQSGKWCASYSDIHLVPIPGSPGNLKCWQFAKKVKGKKAPGGTGKLMTMDEVTNIAREAIKGANRRHKRGGI